MTIGNYGQHVPSRIVTPFINNLIMLEGHTGGQGEAMKRIKVINEPSDLVPILRALDTEVRFNIFMELIDGWLTMDEIEEKYGDEGIESITYFEKVRLVETTWQPPASKGSGPVKAFRSYYTSFHLNVSLQINELAEILSVVMMPDKEYRKSEKKIVGIIGDDGAYVGDVQKELDTTLLRLRALVKRSAKLEYRGQRIEQIKQPK